ADPREGDGPMAMAHVVLVVAAKHRIARGVGADSPSVGRLRATTTRNQSRSTNCQAVLSHEFPPSIWRLPETVSFKQGISYLPHASGANTPGSRSSIGTTAPHSSWPHSHIPAGSGPALRQASEQ